MSYEEKVTELTVRQFVDEVGDQHYPMAGAVVAVSAAQACALGEACMQISLDNQVDRLNWQDVTGRIERMVAIKDDLLDWCNRDASAINRYMAGQPAEDEQDLRRLMCDSPYEVGRLSVAAAKMLQEFRPLIFEKVEKDLDIAIHLLASAARAALLVLVSNLRIWPDGTLPLEYNPRRAELEAQIKDLPA